MVTSIYRAACSVHGGGQKDRRNLEHMEPSGQLWHGGFPGLRIGQTLDASHGHRHLSSCPLCHDRLAGTAVALDPLPGQPGRIYLTTDREYARYYASLAHYGDLYQVEAVGELVVSDEDRFPAWTAQAAVVTSVYARAVLLTDGQRKALLKRWLAADAVADGWADDMAALSPADLRRLHRSNFQQVRKKGYEIAREAARRSMHASPAAAASGGAEQG